ncbi:MAG TPA: DegT/DnrJ/EryC1/StrS family aminotransferase [Caulobacteraceae bacterium]|jgi:perosamine synthetase|nr:DegT/DnrJ/EryC1/StrS family aminotransferase [Caulobacteraceae bacterium]
MTVTADSRLIQAGAPQLDGREAEYVAECLATSWISSNGRFIADFEAAVASFLGVEHAVATCNGTVALHLALAAMGIGPGDEVLVPTLTFIASANAVTYCGARPVFVDCEADSFNLDPAALAAKITPRTRAIMPVHLFGHPVDMDPVIAVARAHGLMVIEDAAEAIGARYKGRPVGALGDCATLSFYGNKIITTGEGGMVLTSDGALAERLRLLRGQGMDPARRFWFEVIGYNYRMTNIAAAIGLAQMERADAHLAARRRIAEGYARRLAPLSPRISLAPSRVWAQSVHWMVAVMLSQAQNRDQVIAAMAADGIETRPVFHPMHMMPPYAESAAYPNAERRSAAGLCLPTHAGLSEADLDRVCASLAAATATVKP